MYSNKLTLSIQPKYMGSRLNMYLFKEDYLNKSYCITRNGYKCNGLTKEDLEKLYSNYIRQAFSEEFIFKYKNNEIKFSNYSGFYKYIKIRAFWAYRFIKNKLG